MESNNKICTMCKVVKLRSEFHKNGGNQLKPACKECHNRAFREKNAAKKLEREKNAVPPPKLLSKICKACKLDKEVTNFSPSHGRLNSNCKECCNRISSERRAAKKLEKLGFSKVCTICTVDKNNSEFKLGEDKCKDCLLHIEEKRILAERLIHNKICTMCKVSKADSEFSSAGYGKLKSRCKPCCNQILREKRLNKKLKEEEELAKLPQVIVEPKTSKVCSKCKVDKSNSEYNMNGIRIMSRCKKCTSQDNKEKRLAEKSEQVIAVTPISLGIKECIICGIEKFRNEFISAGSGNLRGPCKECYNQVDKERRIAERLRVEKLLETSPKSSDIQICLLCEEEKEHSEYEIVYDVMRRHCKTCYANMPSPQPFSITKEKGNENSRKNYLTKTEEQKEDKRVKAQKYYIANKDAINAQHAKYRRENVEKERERHAKFFKENQVAIQTQRVEYYDANPMKKLMLALRSRLYHIYNTGKECYELTDCDLDFLKKWFAFHFELDAALGMNFSNHGKLWHIDHVIPCCKFNAADDSHKKQCFHWSNLRPLLAHDNLSKSGKLDATYISIQNTRLEIFCEQEDIPILQITPPK
jgi:hypothetical protein